MFQSVWCWLVGHRWRQVICKWDMRQCERCYECKYMSDCEKKEGRWME